MKNNDFVLHISGRSKMEQGEKLSGSQLYDQDRDVCINDIVYVSF